MKNFSWVFIFIPFLFARCGSSENIMEPSNILDNQSFNLSSQQSSSSTQTWHDPIGLGNFVGPTTGYVTQAPVVVMDGGNNIIVAWAQTTGSGPARLYYATKTNGVWSFPSTNDYVPISKSPSRIKIAVDVANSAAAIVWRQKDATGHFQVYKCDRFNGAPTFTCPTSLTDHISIGGTNVDQIAVSIGRDLGIIAWTQKDSSGNYHIFKATNFYSYGTNNYQWTLPTGMNDHVNPAPIAQNINCDSIPYLDVKVDNYQHGYLAWMENESTNSVVSIFYASTTGYSWQTPGNNLANNALSTPAYCALRPKIAINDSYSNPIAHITWQEISPSHISARYDLNSAEFHNPFGPPVSTTANINPLNTPYVPLDARQQIESNAYGYTVMNWNQLNNISGSNGFRIYKSEKSPGGGWAIPSIQTYESIDTSSYPSADDTGSNGIAVDNNKDVVMAWLQSDSIYTSGALTVYRKERRNGIWTSSPIPTQHISPAGSAVMDSDSVSVDMNMDGGNAIIVWAQKNTNGKYRVFKSEYY